MSDTEISGGSNLYDEIPYPSGSVIHSHPDRLATMAALYGMTPEPVTACRVLEIACGNGANLIPMAHLLTGSEFVGIDLARKPIADGLEAIAELGLRNIQLKVQDLCELGGEDGQFNYIIAHGVFSWVPPEVRTRILEVCQRLLTPNGVALISYNAQPGGHIRSIVRDMMLFHTQNLKDPAERVEQARALVRFVAEARHGGSEFSMLMQSELERIRRLDPNYLLHDDLSDWNSPYYFTEFIAEAMRHGLQFLAEADPFEMEDTQFPAETRAELSRLSTNRLLREQYIDFLKCRRFRITLLCHAGRELCAEPNHRAVPGLYSASRATLKTAEASLAPDVSLEFESPRGPRLDCPSPAAKAALLALIEAWPERQSFASIVAETTRRLVGAGQGSPALADLERFLAQFLLKVHGIGIVDLHSSAPAIEKGPGERPLVDALARWQAKRGRSITTRRHDMIRLNDPVVTQLVTMLDGTRSLPQLAEAMEKFITQGKQSLDSNLTNKSRAQIEDDIRLNLEMFARVGLFVPR